MTLKLQAKPHEGQREVHDSDARFRVLAAGRRFGKTRLGIFEAFETAFSGGRVWICSPSYKMGAVNYRPLTRIANQIPGAEVKQGDRQVNLSNGGSITVKSCDNPQSLRGEGLDFAILDEASYIDERAWTEAIRPALSDKKGKALIISTPRGKNWFWRVYQRGQTQDDWSSFTYPTASNPYIDEEEIEAARADLPERIYQQEYEARFIEDGGGVFRKVLDAVTDEESDTGRYVIGCDWGRTNDSSVFTVLNIDTGFVVDVVRLTKVDYQTQVRSLASLHEQYPGDIIAETNSMGGPIVESLQNQGLPVVGFNTTSVSKQQIIDGLVLAFEQGLIKIPNNPVLIGELQAFESKRLASGRLSYSAPQGMHDDHVMSLALAWSGKETSEPLVLLSI
tara:strand:- start:11831 stop:13009 length:1179 start_codon:yes stop_codon:yes gene_type:complete